MQPLEHVKQIESYFPNLTNLQRKQFGMLKCLYDDWNNKINVISRKDMDSLYEHHVLHSLAIAKYVYFKAGSKILDVGTGGGFPGIPLAILFPEVTFKLIDSIGKKILVANEIAKAINLQNVDIVQKNIKSEKQKFDFVVSRAVMNASELVKLTRKNIQQNGINAIPNGLICLKGGNLDEELKPIHHWYDLTMISDYFAEEFFKTKKILYIPLKQS